MLRLTRTRAANRSLILLAQVVITDAAWRANVENEYEHEEDDEYDYESVVFLVRSRFPCPRYSSCIRRLSRKSAIGPEATISPCCNKYPLSATANARPAFCSTSRTAAENFARTSAITERTSLISSGDKPSDGSSSNRMRGRAIRPRAIASICCCPPLSSPPLAVRFVARTLK